MAARIWSKFCAWLCRTLSALPGGDQRTRHHQRWRRHRGVFTRATQRGAQKNLLVITVGVGTINGGPIPDENNENGLWLDADNKHVISKLQPEMLKRLAVETNGDFYHMNGSTNLTAFAQSAAEKLNRHEEKFSVNKAPNDLLHTLQGLHY